MSVPVRSDGLGQPAGAVMVPVEYVDDGFLHEAVQEAIHRYGRPEIFNTDLGSKFTRVEFTQLLKDNGIAISMDGKGCWRDNVFVERLWKSFKYEEVYMNAYETMGAARSGIGRYLEFYNSRRPHSTLTAVRPMSAFISGSLLEGDTRARTSGAGGSEAHRVEAVHRFASSVPT